MNQVDEVGRLAGVDAGVDEMQRLGLGALGLILGDGAGFDHGVEHQVAALDGALGMAEGIEVVGPLDDAGEQRALGQIELAHIFAEVGLRRLAEAVDGEAAALAEVDLVGVHLEDLLLGEAMLELEGDDDLGELALDALLGRRGRSRAPAAWSAWSRPAACGGQTSRQTASASAAVVDAAVLEEAAVLDGEHGLHQVRRNLVVGDAGGAWCGWRLR